MKNKLMLAAVLGMISLTSVSAKEYTSEVKDAARTMCRSRSEVAQDVALARDKGIPRADVMEAIANGDYQDAKGMRDMIRIVYDNDVSPDTLKELVRKSCMKQFFK